MSQFYSTFIYYIQLIVLENCHCEYLRISNSSSSLLNTSILSILNEFINFNIKSVSIKEIRSISEILSLRAYCFSINKNFLSFSYQILVNSTKKIICNNVTISIYNIKVLYSTLVSDAYDLLFKKLLFNQDRKKFDSITLDSTILTKNFNNNS